MNAKAGIRIVSITAAVWCLVQVAFLLVAFSRSPPSPDADLVSTHLHAMYLAFLVFHGFAAGFFIMGAAFNIGKPIVVRWTRKFGQVVK